MSEHDTPTTPATVVRRAPFSDNPTVGPRGLRTQQRILDAALDVLGRIGYHQCSIQRITEGAGCSRASFYQYFSGKEDVFRHLAAQVVRQVDAATDWLDAVADDEAGWAQLRAWVGRYAEIYDRHEAVFHAFQPAMDADAGLVSEVDSTGNRQVTGLLARIDVDDRTPRPLEPVVTLLVRCLTRTLDDLSTLHTVSPDAYPRAVVLDAFTDVAHRTFFGVVPEVNTRHARTPTPPRLSFGPVMQAAVDGADASDAGADQTDDVTTRRMLVDAGRDVFVVHGFHATRVDTIVEAAGVSHGTFYHYFDGKESLAQELAAAAMRTVSTTLRTIPEVADEPDRRAVLRRWLRAYDEAQAGETAVIRVWVDAALQDDALVAEAAAVLEWGRRQMARFLRRPGAGDIEADAIVLLALLDGLGVRARSQGLVDAALEIIDRGFLQPST